MPQGSCGLQIYFFYIRQSQSELDDDKIVTLLDQNIVCFHKGLFLVKKLPEFFKIHSPVTITVETLQQFLPALDWHVTGEVEEFLSVQVPAIVRVQGLHKGTLNIIYPQTSTSTSTYLEGRQSFVNFKIFPAPAPYWRARPGGDLGLLLYQRLDGLTALRKLDEVLPSGDTQ